MSIEESSVHSEDDLVRLRVLRVAREQFFTYGYSALTMDALARELGMSKKTIYRTYRSKDALVSAVLEDFGAEVRAMAKAVFADTTESFTVRFHRFIESMVRRFSMLRPHVLRDLERSAPRIMQKIEELRGRNIPEIFGRAFLLGQQEGLVRTDIDPRFAAEFWRGVVSVMMSPSVCERLEVTPDQAFDRAIRLFFSGLFTDSGLKDYENCRSS